MQVNTVIMDLMNTAVECTSGHPEVATARYLDSAHPGILRDVLDVVTEKCSWENRTKKGYQTLHPHQVREDEYREAAEIVVKDLVYVPKPVKKTFDKLSRGLETVVTVSGLSRIMSELIKEYKLMSIVGDAEIITFGTKLPVDNDGYFEEKVEKIYGYEEREKIARTFRGNGISLVIGDNKSDINLGMVEIGSYGALIANWNRINRKGNLFCGRIIHLPVIADQILGEAPSVYKWLTKGVDRGVQYEREITPELA